MSPSTCARVAAALFAAQAIFAIVHRATGSGYRGLTHGSSVVVDLGLTVIWLAAAVAGLVRRSGLALVMMCVGAMVSLIHGINFSVSTSSHGPYGVGIPFVFAAIAETYLIARAIPALRPVAVGPREPAPAGPLVDRHARSTV
jgi:hypothetical protein